MLQGRNIRFFKTGKLKKRYVYKKNNKVKHCNSVNRENKVYMVSFFDLIGITRNVLETSVRGVLILTENS